MTARIEAYVSHEWEQGDSAAPVLSAAAAAPVAAAAAAASVGLCVLLPSFSRSVASGWVCWSNPLLSLSCSTRPRGSSSSCCCSKCRRLELHRRAVVVLRSSSLLLQQTAQQQQQQQQLV
ncbi:hypothetical protein Emag_005142 [Eimeria magna]